MGDRMYVELEVGPLDNQQLNQLPEVMKDLLDELGLEYCPEETGIPGIAKFELPEMNHGIQSLGDGDIECLREAAYPYRVSDDGGNYHKGSDVIWHPNFGNLPPLRREANQDNMPVVSLEMIDNLKWLNDAKFGRVIRGLVRTNPADPALTAAYFDCYPLKVL